MILINTHESLALRQPSRRYREQVTALQSQSIENSPFRTSPRCIMSLRPSHLGISPPSGHFSPRYNNYSTHVVQSTQRPAYTCALKPHKTASCGMYIFTEISSRDLTKKKTIKKRDLWFFLMLFAKLLVQVLCAGARDTLLGCGVPGDYTDWLLLSYWCPTFTKLYATTCMKYA